MRLSLPTVLLCAILLSTTAWSQRRDVPRHPADPNAELIGTMKVNITPQSEMQRERSLLDGAKSSLAMLISVFRSEGRIDYSIDAESIEFLGECGWVDGTSTKLLFDLVARTAILQGLADGITTCPSNCAEASATPNRVYTTACVTRSGSGSSTRFKQCNPQANNTCMREYTVCCPLGLTIPQIDLIRTVGGPCEGGAGSTCEATCP